MSRPARAVALLAALAVLPLVVPGEAAVSAVSHFPTTCYRQVTTHAVVHSGDVPIEAPGPGENVVYQARALDTTPCDTAETPSFITTAEVADLLLPDADEEDWFAFRAFCGETLSVTAAPERGVDIDLALRRPAAPYARVAFSDSGGLLGAEEVNFTIDGSGEWRIRTSLVAGGGRYTLQASAATPPPDAGTGVDASPEAPVPLPAAGCAVGSLPAGDDGDAFTLAVGPQGARLQLLPARDAFLDVTLIDPFGEPGASLRVGANGTELTLGTEGAWSLFVTNAGTPSAEDLRSLLYGLKSCWPVCQG